MTNIQEEKFESWCEDYIDTAEYLTSSVSTMLRKTWEACLKANNIEGQNEIPEGYFKIGEKVEIATPADIIEKATIVAFVEKDDFDMPYYSDKYVRRAPAWKPKEGEAVFVYRVAPEVVSVCNVYRDSFDAVSLSGEQNTYDFAEAKPFDPKKIGWSWEAI